tara:strand:- start:671 stop:1036 length:366 start_codon:yes stop_codon:yes gene_type:complete
MNQTAPDLDLFAGMPRDGSEPIFQEPWEAQVFAMVVYLNETGIFTWQEWTERLSRGIQSAQAAGDSEFGDTYYRHWLTALEDLIAEKGLTPLSDLAARKKEWRQAYLATPHGEPVELRSGN